ncbi:MAG: hypothetical protein QF805_30220, partial [Pirellulaceae bacterium]|nr:hypothetical protein [Pirellulaceae bacterium]
MRGLNAAILRGFLVSHFLIPHVGRFPSEHLVVLGVALSEQRLVRFLILEPTVAGRFCLLFLLMILRPRTNFV